MANIANIINVSLLGSPGLAERDNMNICAVFTGLSGVLSTAERFRSYTSEKAVAADFGSAHEITQHAKVFFASSPNPVNAEGRFVAAYWRSVSENVAASAGVLSGGNISSEDLVSALQQISDGEFDIDVDGSTINLTALNFQSVASIQDVVSILDNEVTGITGATVTFDENAGFVVTSDTTGATSTISFATDPAGSGTYVGDLLALSAGSGASIVAGAAASVLTPETKVEALTAVHAQINFKGFDFIAAPTGTDVADIAAWVQANDVLGYEVYSDPDELNVDPSESPWLIKISGLTNYRGIFRKDGNRKAATAYMARMHVVNFAAINSALTMQLKELAGIPAEDFSQTEIDAAKTVGLDIYTLIKKTPGLLTSGANDYTDNRYNLIAFVDAVATDLFNVLKGTNTKIPQTVQGVNQLVDQAEKTCTQFRTAGVFAPGTWNSPDSFGDIETFKRNIEENGFYVLAGRLSDQTPADRQARKSPVLQIAVKNAGAIHSANVIINFNE